MVSPLATVRGWATVLDLPVVVMGEVLEEALVCWQRSPQYRQASTVEQGAIQKAGEAGELFQGLERWPCLRPASTRRTTE